MNDSIMVIGPIRPIYIKIIMTIFPTSLNDGVSPAVNPTVAKPEKASKHRSIKLCSSVIVKQNKPTTTNANEKMKIHKERFKKSISIRRLKTLTLSSPLNNDFKVIMMTAKVTVFPPPAVRVPLTKDDVIAIYSRAYR